MTGVDQEIVSESLLVFRPTLYYIDNKAIASIKRFLEL